MTLPSPSIEVDAEGTAVAPATAALYDDRYRQSQAAQFPGARKAADRRLVDLCFSRLCRRRAERLLDLGCGQGGKTRWLAEHAAGVTAIDFSAEAMAQAAHWNAHPAIRYVQADVEAFTPEPRFDCITSFGLSTTNLDDPDAVADGVLGYLRRFAAPGATYLHYSKSDLSGRNPGWKYHAAAELDRILARLRADRLVERVGCIFLLPNEAPVSWTHPAGRLAILGFSALYRLARRRDFRYRYLIVVSTRADETGEAA